MCKLKSGIILKNRVFVPEYDSHTQMLKELGITDDYINASKTFVRVELGPTDGDVFSDIDGWKLSVDQDILPDWYDEAVYKPQVVEAVKEWAKTHIHIGVTGLDINSGENHYIKDCHNVEIHGSATVENICGLTTVEYIYDSATVENICDSATVENICGSATVKFICGSATVKYIHGLATVKNICGSATVEYIYDSATVESICSSATVKFICGSATVKYICGLATVKNICDSATVKNIHGLATVERAKGFVIISSSKIINWKNKSSLILSENAIFRDCLTKTIYQSGNWRLSNVKSGHNIS